MSETKSLSVIFDEIEQDGELSGRSHLERITDLEKDRTALVKALRRYIFAMSGEHSGRAAKLEAEVTAILTSREEKKELGK